MINLKEAGRLFQPQKVPLSSVVLATTFVVQSPMPLILQQQRRRLQGSKSDDKMAMQTLMELQYKVLREVYNDQSSETLDVDYILNSTLFHCVAFGTSDAVEPENLHPEYSFLVDNLPGESIFELCTNLLILVDALPAVLAEKCQQTCLAAIKSILISSIAKLVVKSQDAALSASTNFTGLLDRERITAIVDFCQRGYYDLPCSLRSDYYVDKNRQSYIAMLRYSGGVGMSLDLEYMIRVQSRGYDVLRYYKAANAGKKDEKSRIADVKLLISEAYRFYRSCDNLQCANPFLECLVA
jgi:hypothetical protein